MPLPPPPPAIIWQQTTPTPSVEEIIVGAKDALSGHQAAMSEASEKWPGQKIHVMAEGLDEAGQFHLTFSHESVSGSTKTSSPIGPPASSAPDSDKEEGISTPKAVIFLSGDTSGFGQMPSAPPSSGKPIIVATKGDSEDHQIMDGRWKDALNGDGLLWTSRLAWKYRTSTVVFRNAANGRTVLEQNGAAVDCGKTPDDPRKAVEKCLSDDSSDGEDTESDHGEAPSMPDEKTD